MDRASRLRVLLVAAAAAAPVLAAAVLLRRPIGSLPIAVSVLLLLGVVHFFRPFRPAELAVLALLLVPALFTAFHGLSALERNRAYALTARCVLALALEALLVSLGGLLRAAPGRIALQLAAVLGVPALFGWVLLRQGLLLSLALPVAAGLVLYYLSTAKRHG